MFTYDHPDYADSFEHIGSRLTIQDGGMSMIKCLIPGRKELYDAMGVWPYCTQPNSILVNSIRDEMIDQGLVSYFGLFRPGHHVHVEAFRAAGFEIRMLKEHFVYDPSLPLKNYSPKTRYNINRGRRLWNIRLISLSDFHNEVADFHDTLASSRSLGRILNLKASHFAKLAQFKDVQVLGAFDAIGLGAVLVTVHDGQEVHFHALAGAERAYKNNAFYALYQESIEQWGKDCTLYMGGIPGSLNALGVARFKQRFSNRTAPIFMAQIILNQKICDSLFKYKLNNTLNWFPPYRARLK